MSDYKEIKTLEQLYDVLVNEYDVFEKSAETIIDNLASRHHFSESEEILLESYGVPNSLLNYLKKNINKMIPHLEPKPFSLVGPFFYINNTIISSARMMCDYDKKTRFYDSPVSHFDFFLTLGIEGDYGNYPRGRVIYDSKAKRFIVYADKTLLKEDTKKLILEAFLLFNEDVLFKRDCHYTHDNL